MKYQKVTAIIRGDLLEKVEQKLQEIGVQGVSITKVKGYGEYANFYSKNWMDSHARIEIFTLKEKTDTIAQTIMGAAHLGLAGDGIIAVLPVEKIYRIRTRAEITTNET